MNKQVDNTALINELKLVIGDLVYQNTILRHELNKEDKPNAKK